MDLELRKIGKAYGLILPDEVLRALAVKEGDELTLLPNKEGNGYQLTAKDAEFERQIGIARSLLRRYRDTLGELSK